MTVPLGMAVRIGTAEDMKDMTASAMLFVCERAEEIAASSAFGGGIDRKAKKSQAFGDYMRALDAVRGSAAKLDGGEEAATQRDGGGTR